MFIAVLPKEKSAPLGAQCFFASAMQVKHIAPDGAKSIRVRQTINISLLRREDRGYRTPSGRPPF